MKRPITIISSISILLFVTAIIYLGSGFYNDKKGGSKKADVRYEKLLNDTKLNFEKNPIGSQEFSNTFIRSIGSIDDFSSLQLEVNGQLVYSYPPNSVTFPSTQLVKSYEDNVYNEKYYFTLRASLYLMTPPSIYQHTRLSFILILIGTVISCLLILFIGDKDEVHASSIKTYKEKKIYSPLSFKENNKVTLNTEKDSDENSKKDEENQAIEKKPLFDPEKSQNKDDSEKAQITSDEIVIKEESWYGNSLFDEDDDNDDQEENSDKDDFSENNETTISFDDKIFDQNTEDEEDDDDGGLDIIAQFEEENRQASEENFSKENTDEISPKIEEKSLTFDDSAAGAETSYEQDNLSNTVEVSSEEENKESLPDTEEIPQNSDGKSLITDLQLQSEFEPNLSQLLQNNEDPLTVALFKVNALDRGNSISRNIISILKDFYKLKQIFEYKADSYALIVSMDLQSAVNEAEELYNKIADYLRDNNAANEVSIGLSAVSGREITSRRLITEADQALVYASSDPDSPIVAFRANPEKYREFIENQ